MRTLKVLGYRILLAGFLCGLFVGCNEGGGALSGMSDQDLAKERSSCMRTNPTSPGRVTACENIREECERRRQKGNYSC